MSERQACRLRGPLRDAANSVAPREVTRLMPSCPVCAARARRYRRAEQVLRLREAPAEAQVWRCSSCGLAWLEPYPVPGVPLYERTYYDSPVLGDRAYEAEQTELEPCYREVAARFLAHGARTVLDVGCGTGVALAAFAAVGFEGIGVEMSAFAAERARGRGLAVLEGQLEEVSGTLRERVGAFDAVHCAHVLEHSSELGTFLAHLSSLVRRGGVLYAEVPNQFRNVLEWLSPPWRRAFSVASVHHHYFFSPSSLVLALSKAGFQVQSLTTFRRCRRVRRPRRLRTRALQAVLRAADLLGRHGDVIGVWAVRR